MVVGVAEAALEAALQLGVDESVENFALAGVEGVFGIRDSGAVGRESEDVAGFADGLDEKGGDDFEGGGEVEAGLELTVVEFTVCLKDPGDGERNREAQVMGQGALHEGASDASIAITKGVQNLEVDVVADDLGEHLVLG